MIMMSIKILVHVIAIIAYLVIALKCYQRLSSLDILDHNRKIYNSLDGYQKFIYLLKNRYFLGYCLILIASTEAFFLLIGELWVISQKNNAVYWSLTHLGLVIGFYLTRGFKFHLPVLDKFREVVYKRFKQKFFK